MPMRIEKPSATCAECRGGVSERGGCLLWLPPPCAARTRVPAGWRDTENGASPGKVWTTSASLVRWFSARTLASCLEQVTTMGRRSLASRERTSPACPSGARVPGDWVRAAAAPGARPPRPAPGCARRTGKEVPRLEELRRIFEGRQARAVQRAPRRNCRGVAVRRGGDRIHLLAVAHLDALSLGEGVRRATWPGLRRVHLPSGAVVSRMGSVARRRGVPTLSKSATMPLAPPMQNPPPTQDTHRGTAP